MEFTLTAHPIEPKALIAGLDNPGAGACVTFEGRVRDTNDGRDVTALDYEAYGPLAEKEGARIMAEAREKFGILGARCVHRTGSLALGDLADVAAHIFGQLIRGDDPVARFIGFAFEAFDDVVSKDAVAFAPILAFKRALAVAAGGEREHGAR